MDALTYKYVMLLSNSLERFTKKGDNLYNFRCNICGDSKRNPRKARGYIYYREGETWYKCHKCGCSKHFDQYLKETDYSLFSEYIKDKIFKKTDDVIPPIARVQQKKKLLNTPFDDLVSIAKLPNFDPMKKYVQNRKIPEFAFDLMFKSLRFKAFTNSVLPGKFSEKSLRFEEERLIIPFFTEAGEIFGFTGRTIDPKNELRYININLDETVPKLYGMERLDKKQPIYVVEGPLDSLFLPNALASLGNKMTSALRDFPNKENLILVYDNERRSNFTNEKIKEAIAEKYNVCIWPNYIEGKDINSLIEKGMTKEEIKDIIDKNTYSGLQAQVRLVTR